MESLKLTEEQKKEIIQVFLDFAKGIQDIAHKYQAGYEQDFSNIMKGAYCIFFAEGYGENSILLLNGIQEGLILKFGLDKGTITKRGNSLYGYIPKDRKMS